jgi:hypothetical protein
MPAGSSGPVNSIGDINLNVVAFFCEVCHQISFFLNERYLKLDCVMIIKDVQITFQLFFDLKSFRFL